MCRVRFNPFIRFMIDRRGCGWLSCRPRTPRIGPRGFGMRRRRLPAFAIDLCEPRRLLSTTYYVSPTGSDSNAGTSPASAFQSIAKVNALDLEPGDQVLFQGGQTFSGAI